LESNISKSLSSDQLRALDNKSRRVKKWGAPTVKKGLNIQLVTSSSGYNLISKNYYPLPAARTLSRKTQHIKFRPGPLTEVIQRLSREVEAMADEDKDCLITFDDMAIQQAVQENSSTNTMFGFCNLPAAKTKSSRGAEG